MSITWTTARSRSLAGRARRSSTAARPTRGSAAAPAAWRRTLSRPARRTSSTASEPASGAMRKRGGPARPRHWCSIRRALKSSAAWTVYGGHALKSVGYAPLRAVVRDCAAASDAVIATDQAIVPAVLRHLPAGQDRVHLIPNGIDVRDLDALVDPSAGRATRTHAGIADDETVFVSVGRLEANKGFADLAEALPRARSRHAGDGCSWATAPNGEAWKRRWIAWGSQTACALSAGSRTARCTPGTTPPICSCIPRATRAARW